MIILAHTNQPQPGLRYHREILASHIVARLAVGIQRYFDDYAQSGLPAAPALTALAREDNNTTPNTRMICITSNLLNAAPPHLAATRVAAV